MQIMKLFATVAKLKKQPTIKQKEMFRLSN